MTAAHLGLAWKGGQSLQRVEHLWRRTFEHATTA